MKEFHCVLLIIMLSLFSVAQAQEKESLFKDTLDDAFDMSKFLTMKKGVLPIVYPVTEPAVGYGVAGGLSFFIPKKDAKMPPDIVSIVGGWTETNTWMLGGMYLGFWKGDRVRYRGGLGYGDMKLPYYGISDTRIDFNIKSWFFLQQCEARIGQSSFFIGGRYQLSTTSIPLFENIELLPDKDLELWNSGVSALVSFDNTNSQLSPSQGNRIELSYNQNLEVLGSSDDWATLELRSQHYIHTGDHYTPGFLVAASYGFGGLPFYAQPYIQMRGVSAMRYQGRFLYSVETEQYWHITKRWDLLAFGGYGMSFEDLSVLEENKEAWNVGAGFRYLIARVLGLKMGIDVAKGPEQWAFYLTVGSAWGR